MDAVYTSGTLAQYLSNVINRVRSTLEDAFLGFYVYGSVATESYVRGRSDVDAIVVVARSMTDLERTQVHKAVAAIPLPSDIRGLDLSIASSAAVLHPAAGACWEMMLQISRTETGYRARDREPCDPRLPLDLALARQQGVPLAGPAVGDVIGPVPRALLLSACTENVRLWAGREVFSDPASGVLNACRAWQYLEEGKLSSKPEGGQWALTRGGERDLIESALVRYRGDESWFPSNAEVKRFFQRVLNQLEAAGS